MADFIFEKGDDTMDLNDDEQAILDEIEIDHRPLKSQRRRPPGEEDDGTNVDIPNAFMNPEKRSGGRPPPPREEPIIDHGEEDVYEPRAPEGGYLKVKSSRRLGLNRLMTKRQIFLISSRDFHKRRA